MSWKNEDTLYKTIDSLKQLAPPPNRQTVLALKAKLEQQEQRLHQRKLIFGRIAVFAKATAFVMLLTWTVSLSLSETNPALTASPTKSAAIDRQADTEQLVQPSYIVQLTPDHEIASVGYQPGEKKQIAGQKKLISQEEARLIVGKSMQLVYLEEQQPVFAYRSGVDPYIEALNKQLRGDMKKEEQRFQQVSPQNRKLYARSKDEAISVLKSEFGITVTGEPMMIDDRNDKSEFRFRAVESKGASLTTEKSTGRVIGMMLIYDDYKHRENRKEAVDSALIASRFLQAYLEETVTQLELVRTVKEGSINRLMFNRAHQGIPVLGHSYEVEVDTATGKIVGFAGDFAKPAPRLPDPENLISVDKAVMEYLSTYPLQPAAIQFEGKQEGETYTPVLAYVPAHENLSDIYIDANSAKIIEPMRAD